MVTGREALDTVGELPEIYDEPFADSSQIPTLLLSRLTRREVTVALSGDGADELFGGYPRHRFADAVFRKSRWLPRPVGNLCGRAAETIPLGMWDATFSLFRKIFPAALRHRNAGDIIPRLAEILKLENKNGIYEALMCQWPGGLPLAGSNAILQTFGSQPPVMLNDIRRMMFADLNLYLPDDILVKVDRASMSAGLEVRVPMLDHRVSEFAATLPDGFLLGGKGKRILRHLLAKKIPEALVERPKKGFGVPLAEWLRGPLREWVEDLLAEESLRKRGLFDPEKVRTVWHQHLSGKADRKYDLWNVLMLQAWLDRWM
jgi:asparagine synthase (glutamine-hydrolysing)